VTTSLLRRATARHGVKMDSPLSAAQIEKFIETYGVNVDEVELSVRQTDTPSARSIETALDNRAHTHHLTASLSLPLVGFVLDFQ
jgi:hypothetical protein